MKRHTRLGSMAAALCMTASLLLGPVTAQADVKFTDVDARLNSWAVNSIYLMASKGVLTGYPDGTFQPNKAVTKAEWTLMVTRLFDKYKPNQTASGLKHLDGFADVKPGYWAYKEITDLYDYSFQFGTYAMNPAGELAFRPDAPLKRLQLAQMLYSFFDTRLMERRISESDMCSVVSQMKDIPSQIYTDTGLYDEARKADGRYSANGRVADDGSQVYTTLFMSRGEGICGFGTDDYSNAQATALASLQSSGIMTANEQGNFRPLDNITRAEAVTILDRIYNYLNRNGWVWDYTTKDLNDATSAASGGTGSSGGSTGSGGTAYDPYSGAGGGANFNPSSNTIVYSDTLGGSPSSSSSSLKNVNVTDYFDDKGKIAKDLIRTGEISTAVEVGRYNYLTIDLKANDKVDVYIILDGRINFARYEELPMTIDVAGRQPVGIITQVRTVGKKTTLPATLQVSLSDKEPAKKK